jgi:hypothetical protein
MIVISNTVAEDLVVEEDTVVDGIITGSAIVRPNRTLIINGIVTGNVVIEQDAQVELNGIVSGDVFNQGGIFHKKGILSGSIVDNQK